MPKPTGPQFNRHPRIARLMLAQGIEDMKRFTPQMDWSSALTDPEAMEETNSDLRDLQSENKSGVASDNSDWTRASVRRTFKNRHALWAKYGH
jgi:hypothetical protein